MTTQYVGNRRLLKLADFLEKLPKHRFNLRVIVDDSKVFDWDNDGDVEKGFEERLPGASPTCGTAACAIGWCPRVFPRNCTYGGLNEGWISVESKTTETSDFDFAREFFGLGKEESYYLFDPSYYNDNRSGNKSVAKRIRRFVQKRPTEQEILDTKLTSRGY